MSVRIMEYEQVLHMLRMQDRMYEDIANWGSDAMNKGRLISHYTV